MGTALDQVMEDKRTQEFWLRRIIAIIIDYMILWIPIFAISAIAWSMGIWGQVPTVMAGILVWFYSAFFETELGYTIGKRIMNLQVVSLDGRPYDLQRGIMRNFSKIHWILLLIDLFGGILGENRTNMRYLDTMTNCEVVDNQVAEWRRGQGLTPPVGGAVPEGVTVQPEGVEVEPTMPPVAEEVEVVPEPPEEDALEVVPTAPEEAEPSMPPKAPEEVPAYKMEPPSPPAEEAGLEEIDPEAAGIDLEEGSPEESEEEKED
jgi:hypothetical protein